MIPANLEECFVTLSKELNVLQIGLIKTLPESKMISLHRTLGLKIRNDWGLWTNSKLKNYFNEVGITHPDDMSSIIITSFWRRLNNLPINFDEQVQFYKDEWAKIK